jgi:hypothetical protein
LTNANSKLIEKYSDLRTTDESKTKEEPDVE